MRKNLGAVLLAAFMVVMTISKAVPAHAKEFEKALLKNGMTVLTQGDRGDLSAACLFVKVGSVDEDKDTSGATRLLINVILSCHPIGNAYPPALKIEQLGGRVEAETHSDFTCFTLVVPTKNLDAAIKVLGDALIRPACPEAALGVEKEALLAREDWLSDRLEDRAYRLFLKKTYEGSPYGLDPNGEAGVMSKLGHDDIQRWGAAYYNPENMLLSITGKISVASVSKMAEEAFRPASEGERVKPRPRPEQLGGPVMKKESVEEASPSGRAAAVLGYTAPAVGSQDYPAMKLAESLLAGGMGSRIFKELREERDLAYSFGSFMPPMRDASRIAFYVVAGEDKVDAAVAGIKKAVEALKSGNISDEELARAKGHALGGLSMEQETALGRAWYAGFYELMGLGADYGEKLARQVERLDKGEVVKAARKYLDDYTFVMLKPQR